MRFLGKVLRIPLPKGVKSIPPAPAGRRFFDGKSNEGMPSSVLPSEVRKKLDNGEEVSPTELIPL